MTSRDKYNAYRRAWWAKSLGEHLTESRVFLPRRLTTGLFVLRRKSRNGSPSFWVSSLSHRIHGLDEKAEQEPSVNAPVFGEVPDKTDSTGAILAENFHKLIYAILASRFPNDTGSTRLRQVGFIAAVAAEVAAGRKPTASSIANWHGQPRLPNHRVGKDHEGQGA